jgi:hypothetical protein
MNSLVSTIVRQVTARRRSPGGESSHYAVVRSTALVRSLYDVHSVSYARLGSCCECVVVVAHCTRLLSNQSTSRESENAQFQVEPWSCFCSANGSKLPRSTVRADHTHVPA